MSESFEHSKLELFNYLPVGANLESILTLSFMQSGRVDIFLNAEQYRLHDFSYQAQDGHYRFCASARAPAKHLKNGQWVSSIKRTFEMEFAATAHSQMFHNNDGRALLAVFMQGRSGNKMARIALYPESELPYPSVEVIGWKDAANPLLRK